MSRATKQQAGYMGAKNGPFLCGMCRFFVDRRAPARRLHDGACTKVAGVIQFYACCNFFKPIGKGAR